MKASAEASQNGAPLPILALIYDFDGTLSPRPMQEYSFLPQIGEDPKAFWAEVGEVARREEADGLITYMHLMYKKAKAKGVRIVAETNRSNDNAPSHRIYVGRAEIGAAWSKRSEEGRDYLSLKLDDPSFNAPIYANLFDDEGGEGYTLLWSRPRKTGE